MSDKPTFDKTSTEWIDEDAITEEEGRVLAEDLGIDVDAWAQAIQAKLDAADEAEAKQSPVPVKATPRAPSPLWFLTPLVATAAIGAVYVSHHRAGAPKPSSTIGAERIVPAVIDGGVPEPVTTAAPPSPCPAWMVLVPGGSFTTVETREHFTVPAFCLDATEVTVAAYNTCVQSGDCIAPYSSRLSGSNPPVEDPACNGTDRANHPVNCVDWDQANTYCSVAGGRLPTDAEWEWAARGGENGWLYPWGDEPPDDRACWATIDGTCAVGSFPTGDNPWGAHDLAGNVLEWTSGFYNGNPNLRVLRGGGWLNAGETMLTAGTRYGYAPTDRRPLLGFRCASAPSGHAK